MEVKKIKKLLNKINDRLDKFESNTKANYEIGLEKIYNDAYAIMMA